MPESGLPLLRNRIPCTAQAHLQLRSTASERESTRHSNAPDSRHLPERSSPMHDRRCTMYSIHPVPGASLCALNQEINNIQDRLPSEASSLCVDCACALDCASDISASHLPRMLLSGVSIRGAVENGNACPRRATTDKNQNPMIYEVGATAANSSRTCDQAGHSSPLLAYHTHTPSQPMLQ